MRDSLNRMEQKVADYVLVNPREVVRMTIDDLAHTVGTSYATVSRFCKRSGFSGYKEFRDSLVAEVLGAAPAEQWGRDWSVDQNAGVEEVCSATFSYSARVLKDSYAMLDHRTVEKAVKGFLSAGRILFFGVGTSGISARYAHSKFFRLGLPCIIELDPVMGKMHCGLLEAGDVLFAISSSGRSREVLEGVEIAKNQGAVVVALSDFAETPLSSAADINLYTTSRNVTLYKEIEMPLLIPQVALIDSLFSCVGMRNERFVASHSRTKQIGDKSKL